MSYRAKQKLPHRTPPSAYHDRGVFEAERRWMLENTWQFVAAASELSKPGDFVTVDLLGRSVIVRNFDSELVALSNVCAHRHSQIRSERRGRQPEMTCQYHGWCYGNDGNTRRIPCAKDFAPIDREQMSIPKYRCEKIGQLVFVSFSENAATLKEFLGPMAQVIEEHAGKDYTVNFKEDFQYEANWKVAVENTLEAYHVQSVHPNTFRKEPGEMRCVHEFDAAHSSFKTDMPFAPENRIDLFFQKSQSKLMRWLGRQPRGEYEHHHQYPNLLISFTDATTVVQSVVPVAPNRSQSIVYQFGIVPENVRGLKRWAAKTWGKLEANVLKRILAEDFAMLPKIQHGLEHSQHEGVLGRCEERIASFQDYWCDVMKQKPLANDGSKQNND